MGLRVSTIVQCGPCCPPPLACGYCNNKDLLTKNVSASLSGFSGVHTCSCITNCPQCTCTNTYTADSSAMNGTYLLQPFSGLPPPAGFAQLCWWAANAPPSIVNNYSCSGASCATCGQFGGISFSNLVGTRRVYFGILHPPGGLQFQILALFGTQFLCSFPFPSINCNGGASIATTYFNALWQTDVIPVDPVNGFDCLNISAIFNAVADPRTVCPSLPSGETSFGAEGMPHLP